MIPESPSLHLNIWIKPKEIDGASEGKLRRLNAFVPVAQRPKGLQPFCKWPRHEHRSVRVSQAGGMDVVKFLFLSHTGCRAGDKSSVLLHLSCTIVQHLLVARALEPQVYQAGRKRDLSSRSCSIHEVGQPCSTCESMLVTIGRHNLHNCRRRQLSEPEACKCSKCCKSQTCDVVSLEAE